MSGLEIPALIALAGGTAVKAAATISAANDEYNQTQAGLLLKRQEADELLSRENVNEQILREQGQRLAAEYAGSFSAAGKRGGGLGGMIQIKSDIEQNILTSRREAEFKAKMIRAGADIGAQAAESRYDAAGFGVASGILETVGTVGMHYLPKKDAESLWRR